MKNKHLVILLPAGSSPGERDAAQLFQPQPVQTAQGRGVLAPAIQADIRRFTRRSARNTKVYDWRAGAPERGTRPFPFDANNYQWGLEQ